MLRPLAELGKQDVSRLFDLAARLVDRQLGQFVVIDRVGTDGAERLAGKGCQLGPVHDEAAALLAQVIAIGCCKAMQQRDALSLGDAAHLPIELVEGLVLLAQRAGVDIFSVAAALDANRLLPGDDVFDRLPPQLAHTIDIGGGHIEGERRRMLAQDRQRMLQIVLVGIVEGQHHEGPAALGCGQTLDGLIKADDVYSQRAHALDDIGEEIGPHLQDGIGRECSRRLGQHAVEGEDHPPR